MKNFYIRNNEFPLHIDFIPSELISSLNQILSDIVPNRDTVQSIRRLHLMNNIVYLPILSKHLVWPLFQLILNAFLLVLTVHVLWLDTLDVFLLLLHLRVGLSNLLLNRLSFLFFCIYFWREIVILYKFLEVNDCVAF